MFQLSEIHLRAWVQGGGVEILSHAPCTLHHAASMRKHNTQQYDSFQHLLRIVASARNPFRLIKAPIVGLRRAYRVCLKILCYYGSMSHSPVANCTYSLLRSSFFG